MSQLLGQLFFIGIQGTSLTADERKFIVQNNIGGVCLFGRNVAEPKQIRDLCAEIQSLRQGQFDKAPLFIGIDMEGGRVHRLKAPFTIWPSAATLGKIDNPSMTYDAATRMAQEMLAVGINLDFAPCVDIFSNPENKVIGDRAFGTTAAQVEKHASAVVRGFMKAGILSCVKHFPGHGNTSIDSHEDLPFEDSTMESLQKNELVPFKKAFRAGADMVMSAHIRFPFIDPLVPATFSKLFLHDLIREELRYKGLVITDDLGMGALTKHYKREEIPVRALEAGADLLLYCNEFDAPPVALEAVTEAVAQGRLNRAKLEDSKARILKLKKFRLPHPDPLPWESMKAMIGTPGNQAMAASLNKVASV